MLDVEKIRFLSELWGWREIECTNPSLISFKRVYKIGEYQFTKARIDVYPYTGTVATALKHPKRGKTQLFRRHVKLGLMMQIFENPRVHTNTGYYRRPNSGFNT